MESKALDAFFGAHPELAEAPEAAGVISAPQEQAPPGAPTAEPVPAPPDPPAPEAKTPEPGLAEIIRQGREERAAKAKAHEEIRTVRDENAQLKDRLAKMEAVDPIDDPVGWAEARGMTPQQMVEHAESILYSLVPDKAPEGFREKMLEKRFERRESRREADARAKAEAAAREQGAQLEQQYVGALQALVESPEGAATAPDTAAWFGHGTEQADTDTWIKSLHATAKNMVEAARAEGRTADISPAKVAEVLEKDIAARAERLRKGRAPAAPKTQDPAPVPAVATKRVAATSTGGLGSGGVPRPKAASEAEALERAKKLIFAIP